MGEPRWLTPAEERAWRAWRRMQTVLPSQLAHELSRDSGLSEPDYEVLSTVSEAPDRSRRLRELAAKMLWSRSRLSHHVARMERRGLVTRLEDPDDGRGCIIELTAHGQAVLDAAAVLHVASVRRHLVDLLTEDQIRALGEIAETVVAALDDAARPGEGQPVSEPGSAPQ